MDAVTHALAVHPGAAWTLAVGLTLAAEIALLRLLLPLRRDGRLSLKPGHAPALALPALDLLIFLSALCVAMLTLGGFGFSVVALCGIPILLRLNGVSLARHFGPGSLSLPAVAGLSLLIIVAVYLPLQLFGSTIAGLYKLLHWPTPLEPAVALFLNARTWWKLALLLIFAVIFAPLAEETLFRGFLHPLLKQRHGASVALVGTAFTFALLHAAGLVPVSSVHSLFSELFLSLPFVIPLLVFALILGLAYEWSGSLLLCIAIHFWFNALTCALLLAGFGTSS